MWIGCEAESFRYLRSALEGVLVKYYGAMLTSDVLLDIRDTIVEFAGKYIKNPVYHVSSSGGRIAITPHNKESKNFLWEALGLDTNTRVRVV